MHYSFHFSVFIPDKYLIGHSSIYKDAVFHGCFNNKNEFNSIFPDNNYCDLYIVEKKEIKNYFKLSQDIQIEFGLSIRDDESNNIIPIKKYSLHKWEKLKISIINCFRNLGAVKLGEILNIENETKRKK